MLSFLCSVVCHFKVDLRTCRNTSFESPAPFPLQEHDNLWLPIPLSFKSMQLVHTGCGEQWKQSRILIMDTHYVSSGKGLNTVLVCWHSMSSGPVRWAIELIQCIEQFILLQPTAVDSAAVLLMGTDSC